MEYLAGFCAIALFLGWAYVVLMCSLFILETIEQIINFGGNMARQNKLIVYLIGQTEGIVGDYNRINHPEEYLKMKEELDNLLKIEEHKSCYNLPEWGWAD